MTTTLTPQDRAAKALATKERKQAEHNAGEFPQGAFVRIKDGNVKYRGLVGKVHSHNDLRDKQNPNITVEIGVVFTSGRGNEPVWFLSDSLERCKAPTNW